MVLEYLPAFARTKVPRYVGKYTIHVTWSIWDYCYHCHDLILIIVTSIILVIIVITVVIIVRMYCHYYY